VRKRSILLLCVAGAVGLLSAVNLIFILRDYAAAQQEYDELRAYAPAAAQAEPVQVYPRAEASQTTAWGLSGINADYIGWIRIPGTAVDYPIVRGRDNEQYTNTTFAGERKRAGAIFMDWRCKEGFGGPFVILYGHNMKSGSMFGSLKNYRRAEYQAAHPEITITTASGETLIYRIREVRVTDVKDGIFALETEYSGRVLVLCTCVRGAGEDVRLVVVGLGEGSGQ